MKGQKVMVPLTYPGARAKLKHATVLGTGTYNGGAKRWVDVLIKGKEGSWRERFFVEDVKEVER